MLTGPHARTAKIRYLEITMTDWKTLALARGIPAEDVDRIIAPLEALETSFRPLTRSLNAAMEPAVIYHAGEDAE